MDTGIEPVSFFQFTQYFIIFHSFSAVVYNTFHSIIYIFNH